ncbi:MAG: hypothetical protein WBP45_01795 [Daejeonella sp.]
MSRIINIISSNDNLFEQFKEKLVLSGFKVDQFEDKQLTIEESTRVYITNAINVETEAGFEDDLVFYRKLLNVNSEVDLYFYSVYFSEDTIMKKVIGVIANSDDVIIDNDMGKILIAADFIKQLGDSVSL